MKSYVLIPVPFNQFVNVPIDADGRARQRAKLLAHSITELIFLNLIVSVGFELKTEGSLTQLFLLNKLLTWLNVQGRLLHFSLIHFLVLWHIVSTHGNLHLC